MIPVFYVVFMLALGLATVFVDSQRHPLLRRQMVADAMGAVWLFLLVLGTLMLITQ